MIQEHRQELQRLAELSANDIGDNENSVKYTFIIPFLESFGYNKKLDFEHSAQGNRIDILIDKVSHHNILIEAKSYGKNLDNYILQQLKRYCDEKRPILAIITNGEEIRFYSPFWRKPDFNETLIYSIARRDLSNDDAIKKIERVLGRQFLEDGNIGEHIEEREKEIGGIKKHIQSLESSYQDKIIGLDSQIKNLEGEVKSIQLQIDQKKTELSDLEREKDEKTKELKKENLIYLSSDIPTVLSKPKKRRLGRKGYEQITDYLIPVIHLIKKGVKHTEAFRQIAKKLSVANSTVSAECTRSLNISTEEFVELVKSNRIKSFLKDRFPADKASLIDQEL